MNKIPSIECFKIKSGVSDETLVMYCKENSLTKLLTFTSYIPIIYSTISLTI